MSRIKTVAAIAFFLCSALANADVISIPIAHLQEARFTDGYKKTMLISLQGYIKVGDATFKSEVVSRSLPAKVVTEDGKNYLKVSMVGQAVSDGEKIDSSGYVLVNKDSLRAVKTVMANGEVTVYRMTKNYPERMQVGSKELISKSDSYESSNLMVPSYKTNEILTLERVNGEKDLYELCETDYDYGKDSAYKKVQSESSSCFIIDGLGELKGYAMLILNDKSRATYQGTIRTE